MSDSKTSKKQDGESGDEGRSLLSDALKKVFTAGVSAAFMTEESIRTYLGEMKLPKEVLQVLLQSASKSKDEITQRMTKEIVGMIQKIDLVHEFSKFAESHKFKISAEVEILKKPVAAKEISKDVTKASDKNSDKNSDKD
jgi:polyhydroxyalkanoate synthesis regulator phasin